MTNIPESINFLKWAGIDGPRKGPDKKYPSFNLRMIAATIDSFLAMVFLGTFFDALMGYPTFDVQAAINSMLEATDVPMMLGILWQQMQKARLIENMMLQSLTLFFVTGLCWHYWSSTPGKMLLRMKIVDVDTQNNISTSQIIRRLIGYIFSFLTLGLGFFWISFDKRRQGLHDKYAHTAVIFIPKIRAEDPTAPQGP